MNQPTSAETLQALKQLTALARSRGDETMAVLLSGVQLYAELGREYELLDVMRSFAAEIQPVVEGTPSAEQLRQLYDRHD